MSPAPLPGGSAVQEESNEEAVAFVRETYGPGGKVKALRFTDANKTEEIAFTLTDVDKETSATVNDRVRVLVTLHDPQGTSSFADVWVEGPDKGSMKIESIVLRRNMLEQMFKAEGQDLFIASGEAKDISAVAAPVSASPGPPGGPGVAPPPGAPPAGAPSPGAAPPK